MNAAMIMHRQQQNWARQQQVFPMQQQQQPQHQFDQNVLRFLSMVSVQQQNNNNNQHLSSINPMMPTLLQQQENQYDRSYVNSQEGLADKIQAVRYLWESENA